MGIRARVGDDLVVDDVRIGGEPRVATILDVLEDGDLVSCRIRWFDNGRELALVFRASSDRVKLIDR
jgi:hypothetical protein